MITARATKQESGPAKQSRDDFVESDNPKGRLVPVVFLLFLASCVAYLRSFLPIRVEARADDKHEQPNKESSEDGRDNEQRVEGEAESEEDVTGGTERTRGSSRSDAPVLPKSEEGVQNSSVTRGNGLERPPVVHLSAGSSIDLERPKDNRPAGQGDTGRTGGGGGGGGGGDGDSRGSGAQPQGPRPPLIDIPNPGGVNPETARNRAPRINGPVYLQDIYGCQAFLISMLALLAGASDADGDSLRVVGLSANSGSVSQSADGDWSFVHDQGMLGPVKLTYFITDGFVVVPQVAYFDVVAAPPILGTSGDDNLLGTQCADTINAGDGNDNIDAREGNDVIIGDGGDDHIVAGAGNDVVYAGAGNDVVFAGSGNDIVFGGAGNDRIYGEDGDDNLMGEHGNDVLFGGAGNDIILAGAGEDLARGDRGNDTLDGGDGDDNLDGGDGADVVIAGAGNDFLAGGDGNDTLFDGVGRDTVDGGTGDDYLIAAADGEADSYDGGAGIDTLDYSTATSGVLVDVASNTASGADIGNDQIARFEVVVGGSGGDTITAGAWSLSMDGAAGNDRLIGGIGDDVVADGAGEDVVQTGEGNDQVSATADAASDQYDGGDGSDTLSYATATLSVTIDLANGRADGQDIGHDLINSFEKIIGGGGDDRLIAGSGSVSMTGGPGRDRFEFQRSDDDQEPLLIRKITDFTVGDRIFAATYEIAYLQETDAGQQIADMFDDIYLQGNQDNRPVRFRFEHLNDGEFTVVDVHDRSDSDDFFSIEVAGHHQLQFTVAIS
ncbi:Ca2+-binding RTX toxin-like protein [Tardiphaga robiniae]|uniref:calcium-binding protein n=1 Tax=Tardiphaga robiniae TaxID=943830 RepID=UPI002866A9EA|nr:cadherin-like domain-containing protein [Tardiphaga robiniae]MDR6661217.1 Ca2+-binding RTX toxin-like protein [Tardiphaga robiniae]